MSRTVILSPHHDDVALFSAFNAIRYRAHIIVVLRSLKQMKDGIYDWQREAEEKAAANELGCTVEFWDYPDDDPDWGAIGAQVAALDADRIFAPALEEDGGNEQHNRLAGVVKEELALVTNMTYYLTYTQAGKSTWGRPVEFEPGWVPMKLRALACHASQASHPQCLPHFLREQYEYVA